MMTTAKELAAATQAQRLAEGYRKRFEAAAMGADNADDVTCSLARTLLRRASGSPQPEPTLDALLQAARERGPMTDAEHQAQRESWAKGEAGMGTDADEARERVAYRAALDAAPATPIPADTRAVVREALLHAEAILLTCGFFFTTNGGKGPSTNTTVARERVAEALDALNAAPTEPAKPTEDWMWPTGVNLTGKGKADVPADTRDVVREALEALIAEKSDYMEHNHLGNPARQHTIKQGRAALAALDAAPTEGETLGYGVLTDGLGLSFRATRAEADTTAAIMRGAGRGKFRIVRLVAEDGD